MYQFKNVSGELKHYLMRSTYQQFRNILNGLNFIKGDMPKGYIEKTNLENHGGGAIAYAVTMYEKGWWIFALEFEHNYCYYVMQPPDSKIELLAIREK